MSESLLEYAVATVDQMNSISSKDFAPYFVERKSAYFHLYSGGLVTSSSHGADFFQNVIRYWDAPDTYYTPKGSGTLSKVIPDDDYENNFVRILKANKKAK